MALAGWQVAVNAAPSFTCRPLLDESASADAQQIGANIINNRNQVLGFGVGAWKGTPSHGPVLWGRDRVGHRNIETADSLSDMNDQGTIVGNLVDDAGHRLPTMWKDGQQIDLGALPAANGHGIVSAINNKGVAVGWSHIPRAGQSNDVAKATLWRNGKVQRLSGLAEKDETLALDINDLGVVVGWNGSNFDPVVWKNSVAIALPHPAGSSFSNVVAINNQGISVGSSGHADGGHGTAWVDLTPVDLGRVSGQFNTEANAINDAGEVVGYAYSNFPTETSPVYWSGLDAAPRDLNELVKGGCVDAFGIKRQLHSAGRINNKGVIVATSSPRWPPNQPVVSFVLTPRR